MKYSRARDKEKTEMYLVRSVDVSLNRSSSFRVDIGCNFFEINNMLQFVEPFNSREGNADYSPLSGFRIFSNA